MDNFLERPRQLQVCLNLDIASGGRLFSHQLVDLILLLLLLLLLALILLLLLLAQLDVHLPGCGVR